MPAIQQSTINFLKKEESERYNAYKDSCGKWTIGVGHLINLTTEHALLTETLTEQAVESLLGHDLITTDYIIKKYIRVSLNQNQYDAITSFIFNEGQGHFAESTLLTKINQNASRQAIEDEFYKWDKGVVNGVLTDIAGLLNRRKAEAKLYFS